MSADRLPSTAPDDLPPSARAMIELLSASLERQARISEQTAQRVESLGDRVDAMGEKVSVEIGSALRHQTKVVSGLVGLALILLGGAAGVGFMGDGYGVSVSTKSADHSDIGILEDPVSEVDGLMAPPGPIVDGPFIEEGSVSASVMEEEAVVVETDSAFRID